MFICISFTLLISFIDCKQEGLRLNYECCLSGAFHFVRVQALLSKWSGFTMTQPLSQQLFGTAFNSIRFNICSVLSPSGN